MAENANSDATAATNVAAAETSPDLKCKVIEVDN
jgi:hypothetical protein